MKRFSFRFMPSGANNQFIECRERIENLAHDCGIKLPGGFGVSVSNQAARAGAFVEIEERGDRVYAKVSLATDGYIGLFSFSNNGDDNSFQTIPQTAEFNVWRGLTNSSERRAALFASPYELARFCPSL